MMTRDEAIAILEMEQDKAVEIIFQLSAKAEKYDEMCSNVEVTTPSGMTPVYLKPTKRKGKPKGRAKGHKGAGRKRPKKIDKRKKHTMCNCPDCNINLSQPIREHKRYIEEIPPVKPIVTEHTIYGYWCPKCKKIVSKKITDAMPNAVMGLRLVVFTAWLHYSIGVSVKNIVKIASVFCSFSVSPGGLTQAWANLAKLLEPNYDEIGEKVKKSGVLNADETGWRLNGATHWLWCFTTKKLCYYLITKGRGSPVIKEFLGIMFKGVLICDFWGAYNKIKALAKQRCLYHLFTELVKVDKSNSSEAWRKFRKKLSRILKDAVRLSQRKDELTTEHFKTLKLKLSDRIELLLSTPYDDKDAKRIIKRLKRHKDELLTFLDFENVSPYNNHAEQQMRKPVLIRKVSQQNRSNRGVETQAILMSLFRTAELQDNYPVESILEIVKNTLKSNKTNSDVKKKAA